MSVEEIERRLNNRFALLTSGERTAPERHRTLMAVIDWSWNLLGDSERALLRRLSRFPDGFGAEAAQVVGQDGDGADVTDALDGLVSQSLISASENLKTGQMRYRMLETVREFGELALSDADEERSVRRAMFAWAEDFAAMMFPELDGTEQVAAFHRVSVEQDNLIAVLRAAIDDADAEVVLSVYATLGFYWSMRGAHSDVTAFGASVLRATRHFVPDARHLDAAIAAYSLVAISVFSTERRITLLGLGKLRAVKRLGTARDARIEALSTLILASTDLKQVATLIDGYRSSSDPALASLGALLKAQLAENSGDARLAMSEAHRAYDLSLQTRNIWTLATAAQSLANLYSQRGEAQQALDWAARSEEALSELQANADLQQLSWLIAMNELALGNTERARTTFASFTAGDSESLGQDFIDLRAIGWAGLAEIESLDGHGEEALTLYRKTSDSFTPGASRLAPWSTIVTAAALCAHVVATTPDRAWVDRAARQVRTKMLVTQRTAGFVDMPVTASGLLGVSVWLSTPEWERRSPELIDLRLRLLAITEQLGSRQDLPALNIVRHADAAIAAHGEAALDAARASVAGLSVTEAFALACELLRAPELRQLLATR